MRRRVTLNYTSAEHEDSTKTREDRGTDTTGGFKMDHLTPCLKAHVSSQSISLDNFVPIVYNNNTNGA